MIKFADFPYERPDLEDLSERLRLHTKKLGACTRPGEAFHELIETDFLEKQFMSYATISEAGATNNSYDAFYAKEERFFNAAKPRFELLIQERNKALAGLPFKNELRALLGDEFFDAARLRARTVSEDALELMEKENALSTEYSEIMSRLCVTENGERLTMPMLSRLMDSPEHEVRKKYARLSEQAMLSAADRLDSLYDELVSLRTAIAHKTGFDTYTDYCLARRARTSYGRAELAAFSGAVARDIVPVAEDLTKEQEKRLGHAVMNYDEGTVFPGREACVTGEPLPAFRRIFGALSPETKVFFDELCEREFFDLALREGKTNGAYSNLMPLCSMPYIFETYNGTSGAVKTFAHECGHGLNSYLHRGEAVMGACDCTSDIAETHSMSMEFFVWRFIDEIIRPEDVPVYQYCHLKGALSFIPYGTAIDRFQTEVYDRPDMTPGERLELWRSLEKRYMPWRKYEEGLFYDQGRMWQRQIHVMKWPFYYIDYVLAQTCALQFFMLDRRDHQMAWNAYLRFIKDSGRYSFSEIIARAELRTPFDEGLTKDIAETARTCLQGLLPHGE